MKLIHKQLIKPHQIYLKIGYAETSNSASFYKLLAAIPARTWNQNLEIVEQKEIENEYYSM